MQRRYSLPDLLLCVLLALCTLAVYAPAGKLGFITYDDPDYLTDNPHVRNGLSWANVEWAFAHTSSAEWHPLTMVSHMLDCQVYGLNPKGHHVTNLALHLANVVLLYLLLRMFLGDRWPAAFVAALFALHPLNVEAVAWISERKGLLSTFFGLLCLWFYFRYATATPGQTIAATVTNQSAVVLQDRDATSEGPTDLFSKVFINSWGSIYYVMAFVFLAAGLLSKPMLVTWPFLMLLLDYWPLRRLPDITLPLRSPALSRLVLEKLPFFALSFLSCVATFLVGRSWGALTSAAETPFSSRLSNSLVAYLRYIQKLIWPVNLSINYPFELHRSLSTIVLAAAALGLLTWLCFRQRRSKPFLFVGWAWYLGTLVPVIGLFHFGNHFMADRYAYVTAIGLFIAVTWSAAALLTNKRFPSFPLASVGIVVLIACALSARGQLQYWDSSETLFKHALAVNPRDFVACNNLGFYFDQRGEPAKAEPYYRAALEINPSSSFAWEKLATILVGHGKAPEAVVAAQSALKLNPNMPDAHCTLGLALMKEGRGQEALEQYDAAIRIRPDFSPAHYNLANALAAQGQYAQATEHYRESLRWDPDSADAHNNLAYVLVRQKKPEEAIPEFRAALKLKPELWQAEFGLADLLSKQGQFEQAIHHFRQVLRSRAEFPEALSRLAWIEATCPDGAFRNGEEAVRLAQRASDLTSERNAVFLRTLAAARAEMGDFLGAMEAAEKARRLAIEGGQPELASKMDELITLFRSSHPYREPGGHP